MTDFRAHDEVPAPTAPAGGVSQLMTGVCDAVDSLAGAERYDDVTMLGSRRTR